MEIKLLDTENKLKSFNIDNTDMIERIHIFYHNNKEICFIEYSDKYTPMKILNDTDYFDYKLNKEYFGDLLFAIVCKTNKNKNRTYLDIVYNKNNVCFDTNYIEIFSNLPGENNERIENMLKFLKR